MTDEQIVQCLAALINTLKSPNIKSKQFAFNKHLEAIETCLNEGLSQKKICETINNETSSTINFRAFETMLGRARKKSGSNNTPTRKSTNITYSSSVKSEKETEMKPERAVTSLVEDWKDIGVTTQRLIDDFIENGLTPEDVKLWQLPNDASRRKKLTEIISRKNKGQ
ncbi:Uncharacterised protein [Yersinia aldovae]|uniref:hypothetical protein n=1 Tax=Yersinia aldovae TaxID=29483 RepID=UPI0005E19671|nr:hypothetical protein [Yersinia aldovae]CNK26179.1 Uncharacterised protein [Yersinia aldovae]